MEKNNMDSESAIKKSLRTLGTYLGADRVLVSGFNQEKSAIVHHKWCAIGFDLAFDIAQRPGVTEYMPCLPWVEQKVRNGEITNVRHINELPQHADAENHFCKEIGIASFLIIPICQNEAFLFFSSSEQIREWTHEMITVVQNSVQVFEHMLLTNE